MQLRSFHTAQRKTLTRVIKIIINIRNLKGESTWYNRDNNKLTRQSFSSQRGVCFIFLAPINNSAKIFLIRYRLFLLANQKQAVYVHLRYWENSRQQRQRRDSDCVEKKKHLINLERLPFVWKTRKFRGEFKWNGSSRWKFSGKKVIPSGVLPFSRSYRKDQNFLYHLFGLPVPGFMSKESEKFSGNL